MAHNLSLDPEVLVRQYEDYLDDLDALRKELLGMVEAEASVAARRSSLYRVKALLRGGTTFRVLDDDYLRPDLPWAMDGSQANVMTRAMITYALYMEVSGRPEYVSIRETKPVELATMLRWVDLVHPMNDRLIPTPKCPTYAQMVAPISKLFSSIAMKTDDLIQLAWKDPHVITLVMDLWLHYPRYLLKYSEEISTTLCAITVSAVAIFDGLAATDGGEDYIVARLLHMVGGHHRRILRLISEQTAFLRSVNMESGWEYVWKDQFGLVAGVLQSPEFIGITAPHCFFQSIITGYRRALDQPDNESMILMSESATLILDGLVCLALRPTNLRRAIRSGVYDVLFDVERAWGKGEELSSNSVQHLEDSLTMLGTLRAFHRRHSNLLHPIEQPDERRTFIENRFKSLLSTYRVLWQQYTSWRESNAWKRLIPCSNTNTDAHEGEVRACPCGEVFYCSKKCQREHWKSSHRNDCSRTGRVWTFEDGVTLADTVFAIELAFHVVKRNEDKILEAITRTVTRRVDSPNPKSVLVVVELSNPPTPDGNFGWTLEDEDDGSSTLADGATEGAPDEGEGKGTEDDRSLTAMDRQVNLEDTREVNFEGPHIASIAAWLRYAGETSLQVTLPFRYDFSLQRPVARNLAS
ncbi:uncharacterized protein SCHCODRAFT_02641492 [Schizophyllum commune H4-8]|uniref:MYND-type domain-containing protein n=1 Tax=Schizophyllum commune (strain H4-8 / FGSC 9210) TaxID=578458 RepID=D8QJF6_SCHCM|nr:uncharacterized protein SCHCODRAFT_02641492 [Schizophyllum commune H4-8]KAI5886350.1 hypothetical protein SCHCODRAFT_02641492 [Schizophyllum commune H4-8]